MWGAKKPMIQEFSICPSQSLQSKFERRGLLCPRSLEESPGLLEHLSVRIVEIRPSSLNFMFLEMRISLPSNMDMKRAPKFGDQKNGCGTSAPDPMRMASACVYHGCRIGPTLVLQPTNGPKVECQSTASIPLTPSNPQRTLNATRVEHGPSILSRLAQLGPRWAPTCTTLHASKTHGDLWLANCSQTTSSPFTANSNRYNYIHVLEYALGFLNAQKLTEQQKCREHVFPESNCWSVVGFQAFLRTCMRIHENSREQNQRFSFSGLAS